MCDAVVERLVVDLSLPVLSTQVCSGLDSNTQPSACEVNALIKTQDFLKYIGSKVKQYIRYSFVDFKQFVQVCVCVTLFFFLFYILPKNTFQCSFVIISICGQMIFLETGFNDRILRSFRWPYANFENDNVNLCTYRFLARYR